MTDSNSLKGKTVGLAVIDPGRTTGLGFVKGRLGGNAAEFFSSHPMQTLEVPCEDPDAHPARCELKGAYEIATRAREFFYECRKSVKGRSTLRVPPERIFFVVEDFILRGQVGSTDRAGISPARVTMAVMAFLYDVPFQWDFQQPGQAKQRWTNDRLRNSGIWVVGSEHRRDVMRHAALWVVRHY